MDLWHKELWKIFCVNMDLKSKKDVDIKHDIL